jgi:hypothetical protein
MPAIINVPGFRHFYTAIGISPELSGSHLASYMERQRGHGLAPDG